MGRMQLWQPLANSLALFGSTAAESEGEAMQICLSGFWAMSQAAKDVRSSDESGYMLKCHRGRVRVRLL